MTDIEYLASLGVNKYMSIFSITNSNVLASSISQFCRTKIFRRICKYTTIAYLGSLSLNVESQNSFEYTQFIFQSYNYSLIFYSINSNYSTCCRIVIELIIWWINQPIGTIRINNPSGELHIT